MDYEVKRFNNDNDNNYLVWIHLIFCNSAIVNIALLHALKEHFVHLQFYSEPT
jgi:hypothetical protein